MKPMPLRISASLVPAVFACASLWGCAKTAPVDLRLVEPCDQTGQALNGIKTLRVSFAEVDPDTGGPLASSGDSVSFSVENPAPLSFPIESEVFITVEAFEGDVESEGASALSGDPVSVGRSVPLTIDNDGVQAILPMGLLRSFGQTTAQEEEGDATCQKLSSGGAVPGRHGHTATWLPTLKKVLIVGGAVWADAGGASADLPQCREFDAGGGATSVRCMSPLRTAELFDPATGTFEALPELPNTRAYHTATLLPDGRVLIVGGFTFIGPELTTLVNGFLFDPAEIDGDPYSQPRVFASQRAMHTATLLEAQNQVAIIGGCTGAGCTPFGVEPLVGCTPDDDDPLACDPTGKLVETVELFDIENDTSFGLELVDDDEEQVARALHAASVMGDFVVVSGGVTTAGTRCNLEVFEIGGDTLERKVLDAETVTLGVCPAGHQQVTVQRDKVAIIGGVTEAPTGVLHPDAAPVGTVQFWTTVGVASGEGTEMLSGRVGHRAVRLHDDSILVVGGRIPQGGATAERLELSGNRYVATTVALPLVESRADVAVTLLSNGQVFAAGGYQPTSGQSSDRAELFFAR